MPRQTRKRPGARHDALKAILEGRRSELIAQLRERIRDVRVTGRELEHEPAREEDGLDGHGQEDLQLSLLQMRSETLRKIEAALTRLDAGGYGDCVECEEAIPEARLRAMPFAIRCRSCEEAEEEKIGRSRKAAAQSVGWQV